MANIGTYDSKRDILTIVGQFGSHEITGMIASEGVPVEVERDGEKYLKTKSREGNSVRFINPDYFDGTLTLNLQLDSPSIAILSQYDIHDNETGAGIVRVMMNDNNSNSLLTANGYVQNNKRAGQSHEWVIALTGIVSNYTAIR